MIQCPFIKLVQLEGVEYENSTGDGYRKLNW
jgi:hypothetical protein